MPKRPETHEAHGDALTHLAAALAMWASRVRARIQALRKADVASPDAARAPSARPLADELATERAASRDLLALDRTLRAYHRLPAGEADGTLAAGASSLFTRGARLELGAVDPRGPARAEGCDAAEFLATLRRDAATAAPRVERSRTVHVVGNVAIAISAFEARSSATVVHGVDIIELRRAGDGWLIHSVVAQPVDTVTTERSATPRPRRWATEA